MSDIFREVDEEIRKERYAALWKKYGPWVIGAAAAIVLAVAGYQGWSAYRHSQAVEASKAYDAANQTYYDGEQQAAIDALGSMADPAAGGYGLLAAFRQAEFLANLGEGAAAVEIWNGIAEQAPEPAFRTLAELFVIMQRFDEADPAALDRRLGEIASANDPFRTTALELQALLAEKQGDGERAVELYKQIADGADVPPQLQRRATEMLAQLEG